MSRPSHTPPVRRPPLPFELDGSTIVGAVFRSGDRWVAVTTDELAHELYLALRDAPKPVIERVIGPALVSLLN